MRFVTGVTVVHPQGGGVPACGAGRKSEIRIARPAFAEPPAFAEATADGTARQEAERNPKSEVR